MSRTNVPAKVDVCMSLTEKPPSSPGAATQGSEHGGDPRALKGSGVPKSTCYRRSLALILTPPFPGYLSTSFGGPMHACSHLPNSNLSRPLP